MSKRCGCSHIQIEVAFCCFTITLLFYYYHCRRFAVWGFKKNILLIFSDISGSTQVYFWLICSRTHTYTYTDMNMHTKGRGICFIENEPKHVIEFVIRRESQNSQFQLLQQLN